MGQYNILASDFSEDAVLACLRLKDLSRFGASCAALRRATAAWDVLARCACRECLPNFLVPMPKLEQATMDREALLKTMVSLRSGMPTGSPLPMQLSSFAQARRLAGAMDRACRRADQQQRHERSAALRACPPLPFRTLVARFSFAKACGAHPHGADQLLVSNRISWKFTRAAGCQESWELRLAWRANGNVLVGARRRGDRVNNVARAPAAGDGDGRRSTMGGGGRRRRGDPCSLASAGCQPPSATAALRDSAPSVLSFGWAPPTAPASPTELYVDITSVSDAVTLHMLDAQLQADGSWSKAEGVGGVVAPAPGTGSSARAAKDILSEGILVVVTVTERAIAAITSDLADFSGETPVPRHATSLHALSIDAPRLSSGGALGVL
mmetsp:Transcript_18914/g.54756  ORF Transcript_18914/g.54756 Transcript_18914/m.54756 type:complete len:383 (+) Transcript_18914:3-1151(+)